jgi:hypothetical protein
LAARRDHEIEQTAWTTSTTMLNWATGLALILPDQASPELTG